MSNRATGRLLEWARRLLGSLRPDRVVRELEEELRQHLEFAAEDAERGGHLSERDVRATRLRAGGIAQAMEAVRDQRRIPALDHALGDVRYGARQLRRSPAFTIAVVATLALAIGATTTMFGVLNTVLFQPLPYQSPEQLVRLWTENPLENIRESRSALWDVEQWRAQTTSFAAIATFDGTSRILTGTAGAERVNGASISANMLSLLGIEPVAGRSFTADEVDQGHRLVLISHDFWRSRFGGSPEALGATLVLDAVPHQIVGVLPADFQVAGLVADIWEPHGSRPNVRGGDVWSVVARLKPSVTFDDAQAEMNGIVRGQNETRPAVDRNRGIRVVPLHLDFVGAGSRLALWMLAGAVLCVFLIAVANVTSLSLTRSVARTQEMAVRAALGASRGRLVRQLVIENMLLALSSGLLGIGVAWVGTATIRTFGPASVPRLNEVHVDLVALAWAFGVSLFAGVLVGLPSAASALRRTLRHVSVEGTRSVVGGVTTTRIRRTLVVTEFALAVVLLVGAGLFVRSWWNVMSLDSGFRPERVLMMTMSTPGTLQASSAEEASSTAARRIDVYDRVLEQIRAVPGVASAGLTGDLFIGNERAQILTLERGGETVSSRLQLVSAEVSTGFFETIGTPLRQGRYFADADGRDAPRVVIVNESMARHAWPGGDPIGRRFKLGARDSAAPWYVVVGVVANMRRQGPEREPFPQMFVPFLQSPPQSADVLVRTSAENPMEQAGALRDAIRRAASDVPIYNVAPLEVRLGTYVAQRHFQTSLLTGFSIVAMLMAGIGIYALIHYLVATRTQELGLRLALGAQAGDIFRMIAREGVTVGLGGIVIGLAGAWILGRATSSLLFGVTSGDPVTFAIVPLILTAVAAVACIFPARRAMRVDAIKALRGG